MTYIERSAAGFSSKTGCNFPHFPLCAERKSKSYFFYSLCLPLCNSPSRAQGKVWKRYIRGTHGSYARKGKPGKRLVGLHSSRERCV